MTPLEEAQKLVTGDRAAIYGPARDDYAAVAQIVSGMFRKEFTPVECAAVMVAVKLARLGHGIGIGLPAEVLRDSVVDGAAYQGHVLWDCLLAAEETPNGP